jgi:hypothetical protein
VVASRSIGIASRPRQQAPPLGILTWATVGLGEMVLMDLARVVSMSEWTELTWDDAMQRGYEALSQGEVLYEETAEEGRSNIDIEKHLRLAELKVAQANAWLAMARELAWQRDDYGGRAAR